MTLTRSFKSIAAVCLAALLLAAAGPAIFGWNWLRAPLERIVLERTGRQLTIGGDLELAFGWPQPRLHAGAVSFANPAWATEKQMLSAEAVDLSIDLAQLLRLNLVFPEIRLTRPLLFLEQGSDGRKNWLLDSKQQDEGARLRIDRLTLDQGRLGYDDVARKTSLRLELSTLDGVAAGVVFSARGRYQGLPLTASGHGGTVLALRDEEMPYPLSIALRIGPTALKADGSVTSLLEFSALDMRLALSGDSLAQLYPLLGIAFPATSAYATKGHLLHRGTNWHYEDFSGHIGASDIAGQLQVDTGGKRPVLTAELLSKVLDFADLGPLIGAQAGSVDAARQAAPVASSETTPQAARMLPEMPFSSERWDSVDAEVSLKAASIRSADELPLADFSTHLSLRDSVLKLDPLDFGAAGGHLAGTIALDGRTDPIAARVQLRARRIQLAQLFPSYALGQSSIGQINGEFDLAGTGNSVRTMLASSSGKVGLVVTRGEISRLMMERAGLHLWEMLELNVSGDQLVKLRCAVADFDVKKGAMSAEALVFDTEVTTILGTGNIDLKQEKLDLTLNQKTKNTSPLAVRSPIHVRGTFAQPDVGVDKGPVAARAFAALALAMVNPLLALLPLIDAGPGSDADCRQLVQAARALPRTPKKGPRTAN